jgi:hypothetical protein
MAHLTIFFRFPPLQCGGGLGRGQHTRSAVHLKITLAKAQRAPSKRSEDYLAQKRSTRRTDQS